MASSATQEQLKELYDYYPETGKLVRKTYCGRGFPGQVIKSDLLSINYQRVTRGRVIWCWYYGEWPNEDLVVDHINRNHNDDRIENLRLATKTQNGQNVNYWPGKGTYQISPWSWAARISIDGKVKYLGHYDSKEEAEEAYKEAAKQLRGEFACHL